MSVLNLIDLRHVCPYTGQVSLRISYAVSCSTCNDDWMNHPDSSHFTLRGALLTFLSHVADRLGAECNAWILDATTFI